MNRSSKLVIAGGSGFLGKRLQVKLRDAGYTNVSSISHRETDLLDLGNCIKATEGADLVIHAAGLVTSRKDQSVRPAEIYYVNNLIGLQLLEACRRNGLQDMILVSSITAYSTFEKPMLKEELLFSGKAPVLNGPLGYYGLSKWNDINAAKAYSMQYGMRVGVVVLPNLYGPGDKFDHEYPPLVPNLIMGMDRAKRSGQRFSAGKGPNTKIDLLYLDDACDLIVKMTERTDRAPFEVVNGGGGEYHSILEIAEEIARALYFKEKIRWDDDAGSEGYCLSNERALKDYGWVPRTSLRDGLSEVVKEFLKNNENKTNQ